MIKLSERKGTVLVAEDEECVLKLTQIILSQQGYTVLEANTPEEALRIADTYTGEIDLLLTDMSMPQMDGFTLTAEFRKTHPTSKVIYMTAYCSHEIKEDMSNETVLNKPFCTDSLCNTVSASIQSLVCKKAV